MEPKVSVLIVTRNRADRLRGCLASLAAQSRLPYEVVVVDNGSSDGTAEVAAGREGRLPVRYVFEPRPSIPRARNVALRHAAGDVALFLDDDSVADPCWVEEAGRAATLYPAAALIQGTVRGKARTVVGAALGALSDAYFDRFCFTDDEPRRLRYVAAGNLLVRLSGIDEPIRFDERIARSSDRELGARLLRQGLSLEFHPPMTVTHDYDGRSLGSVLARFFRNARVADSSASPGALLAGVREKVAEDYPGSRLRSACVLATTVACLGASATGKTYWAAAAALRGRQ
jgi:glycosyltransferase involved in cell wall biosynthesis